MKTHYQLVTLGDDHPFTQDVIDTLEQHVVELGLDKNAIVHIDRNNFSTAYHGNAPAFCLYFGSNTGVFKDTDLLDQLVKEATLVLPVVTDINSFTAKVPAILANVNGTEFRDKNRVEQLVGVVLEGFGLLRLSRRLFISYKRDESTSLAIQLFERLERNGFDVFLDTHSVRPGEPFQDELWHRMADTDVVILLNTPGFLKSHWTTQELAKANSMSIGILQLVWPLHKVEVDAKLSIPLHLEASDFVGSVYDKPTATMTATALDNVVEQTESLRARSLASRQDNIVTEFIASAFKIGKKTELQPEKFITVTRTDGKECIVIPTIGVPQAFTYNQSEEMVARIKSKNVADAFLLYDHRNIREKWLNHLAWLDNYLPIKTVKIVDAESWLYKL